MASSSRSGNKPAVSFASIPLIANNPRPHPDPHAIPPTTPSRFPFDPAKTQSELLVANLLFSLFSGASDPACPKSDRISDSCRGSLAALQAEHTFRLKFPIELAGAHSILSQPERERSKPNFYIVQFGSLGTSADGCSVIGAAYAYAPWRTSAPSIEESILLRRFL